MSKPAPTGVEASTSTLPAAEEDRRLVVARSPVGHQAKLTTDSKDLEVFDKSGARLFFIRGMDRATFDSTGTLIFAWKQDAAVLYEISSGNKLAERPFGAMGPTAFFPDGKRIIEIGDGIRISDVPSLRIRTVKLGGHSEYSQTARRAFVLADNAPSNSGRVDVRLFVYDTDTEKLIDSIPMNEAFVNLPAYSMSGDGKKIGWALGDVTVWDSTTKKVIVLEKGEVPEHPRYYPSAPYFASDGNSVCVEQEGAMRIISIHERKKGMVRHCFFASRARGWLAEASTGDIEAIVIDVRSTPGWTHQTGLRGLYYNVIVQDLSPDRTRVAIMEERPTTAPSDEEEIAVTVADATSGNVIWRKELGRQLKDTHQFEVYFSDDGKVVGVSNGDTGRTVKLDAETGTEAKTP